MVRPNPYSSTATVEDDPHDVDVPVRSRRRLDGFDTIEYGGREWLRGIEEAARWIGRGRTTLYEWKSRGLIRAVKVDAPHPVSGKATRVWAVAPGSLLKAAEDAERRKLAQCNVAGPGRGHKGERDPRELAAARERDARRRAEVEAAKAAALAARRAAEREREALEDAAFERGELV